MQDSNGVLKSYFQSNCIKIRKKLNYRLMKLIIHTISTGENVHFPSEIRMKFARNLVRKRIVDKSHTQYLNALDRTTLSCQVTSMAYHVTSLLRLTSLVNGVVPFRRIGSIFKTYFHFSMVGFGVKTVSRSYSHEITFRMRCNTPEFKDFFLITL